SMCEEGVGESNLTSRNRGRHSTPLQTINRIRYNQEKTMKLPGSKGEHQAQEECGTTRRALSFYNKQMLPYLNPLMRAFIARQEMVFIATADAYGACDCSFRAGLPGFVHVLDDKTLAYPEYRGNGVMASVGNIMENPHIGMIFIDFFQSTVGL